MGRAVNGLGWVIQQYIHEHGWAAVSQPFPTADEAEATRLASYPASLTTRVYESLDHPNQKEA